MKIALIGASGFIGTALRNEALSRGHHVMALVSRPDKLSPQPGLQVQKADALDEAALAEQLKGHDVVLSAFSGHAQADVYGYYMRGIKAIVAAAKRAAAPRLVLVGGAGSLQVSPGVTVLDTPDFPAQWRPTAEGARDALKLLREERSLEWTMLSPPPHIHPGERTGSYRVGGDQVLLGPDGPADISVEDYAVAMIDELESAAHSRRRFTVAH